MSTRSLRTSVAAGLTALLAACAPALSASMRPGTAPVLVGAHNDTSTPFTFVSVPALVEHRYDGRGLRLSRVLAREPAYTRYAVSYRSGRLTITGVMNVPSGPGRHPLVVIAHGYADPARYTSGSMLEAEQVVLAENGFVAFQIDYRNYARSSRESSGFVARPLGYPADLVDAVRAVRRSGLSFVDADRVGLFGRSMGGGVVLDALVARPHLARAAVLYSPISADAADSYHRWVEPDAGLRRRVEKSYGTPTSRPRRWREASAAAYLSRVTAPVQIHHGAADPVCPVRWSEATTAGLRAAGRNVTLYTYPGEDHRFDRAWRLFMKRSVSFLHRRLR